MMGSEDITVGGREINREEGVGEQGGKKRDIGGHRWTHEPWDLWI
jgi:hypothetical protein